MLEFYNAINPRQMLALYARSDVESLRARSDVSYDLQLARNNMGNEERTRDYTISFAPLISYAISNELQCATNVWTGSYILHFFIILEIAQRDLKKK